MTNGSRRFSAASLGLMPAGGNADISTTSVVDLCREIELCCDAIDQAAGRYHAGDRLLELIAFMGCSPHIELGDHGNGKPFTHVIVHDTGKPVLYFGDHTRPPRCPACGKAIAGWRDAAGIADAELACGHCHRVSLPGKLDWRRDAGYTSILIEITEIFPKEAIPQPALLEVLARRTGTDWTYFYY